MTYTKPSANGTGTPVTLTEGTDYTVSYRNNTDACEQPDTDSAAPTVIIKGTGSYSARSRRPLPSARRRLPLRRREMSRPNSAHRHSKTGKLT